MLCFSALLHLTTVEFGNSNKALAVLLQSSRAIPTNPSNGDTLTQANTIPGPGLATHSSKCHELPEQKDIFIDVSYICVGHVAGTGMMSVSFFLMPYSQDGLNLQTDSASLLSLLQTC